MHLWLTELISKSQQDVTSAHEESKERLSERYTLSFAPCVHRLARSRVQVREAFLRSYRQKPELGGARAGIPLVW